MVTADTCALVCVWDLITGNKVMEFNANQLSENVEYEVTDMTFDTTNRRLLTTLNDGTMAIWNFNNGNCLRQVLRSSVIYYLLHCYCIAWDRS